jgi:hypothetical protein
MLITYIKGGTPAQFLFGEGDCNDESYICSFLTEVIWQPLIRVIAPDLLLF